MSDVASGRFDTDQDGVLLAHLHSGGVNGGYFGRPGRGRIDAMPMVTGSESESLDVQNSLGKMMWSAAFGCVM